MRRRAFVGRSIRPDKTHGFSAPSVNAAPRTLSQIAAEKVSFAMIIIVALWVTVLFDPHWYLAAKGPDVILKLPTVLFGGLLLALAFGLPNNPGWRRRWQWYAPYLLLIASGVVTLPWAFNNGAARDALQALTLSWVIVVATVAIIDNVPRAEKLAILYGVQFAWWALW